jgi:hypothetical protein
VNEDAFSRVAESMVGMAGMNGWLMPDMFQGCMKMGSAV